MKAVLTDVVQVARGSYPSFEFFEFVALTLATRNSRLSPEEITAARRRAARKRQRLARRITRRAT